jgi:hypothetical protein
LVVTLKLVELLVVVASAVMAIVGVFSVFIFAGVFAAVVMVSMIMRPPRVRT